MRINRWLFLSLLLFIIIQIVGGYFRDYPTFSATAIYVLFVTIAFFGMFFLIYLFDALYAEVNPWVSEVDRMQWGFNPMYMPWLFSNNRRKWACYATIVSALFSTLAGILIFYVLMSGRIDINSSLISFSIGSGFLAFLAFSWYEEFWKQRTRETKDEEIYEEEVKPEEKWYFPPKTV
ncbi:MAG: hypothetical protein QW667_07980 [Candidatus Bathyarchaeia archaeon]